MKAIVTVIGKDKVGIHFLKQSGADGILSTRANLIRLAKEQNMVAIQRFFLLDSKGLESIDEMVKTSAPHFMDPEAGFVPFDGQDANLYWVASWMENGETQIMHATEFDPTM